MANIGPIKVRVNKQNAYFLKIFICYKKEPKALSVLALDSYLHAIKKHICYNLEFKKMTNK